MIGPPESFENGRIVWAGTYGGAIAGGLNPQNCDREGLAAALEKASELVVLDALSFPWDVLRAERLDVPLIVAIPHDWHLRQLSDVLAEPVLRQMTPFDRIIESRRDIREELQRDWRIDDGAWVSPPGRLIEAATEAEQSFGSLELIRQLLTNDPDVELRTRKSIWRQLRQLVSELLAALFAESPEIRSVTIIGGDAAIAGAVAESQQILVRHCDLSEEIPQGCDDVVVVLLPRVPVEERVDLLRRSHLRVRPAGTLVVIGTVVAALNDERSRTPSTGELIEELHLATGLAVHVEDLRSVRWRGEQFIRGAVLVATSLKRESEA